MLLFRLALLNDGAASTLALFNDGAGAGTSTVALEDEAPVTMEQLLQPLPVPWMMEPLP
jgi:hypothetical protein